MSVLEKSSDVKRGDALRVTSILSLLGTWDRVPPRIREEAIAIGTDVHDRIEKFLRDNTWDERIKGSKVYRCLEGFKKWYEDFGPEPVVIEKRLYSFIGDTEITGKIDVVCDIKGVRWLIDFKTSSAVRVTESYKIQMNVYKKMVETWSKKDIGAVKMALVFLHKKTGVCSVKPVEEDQSKIDRFVNLVAQYKEKEGCMQE